MASKVYILFIELSSKLSTANRTRASSASRIYDFSIPPSKSSPESKTNVNLINDKNHATYSLAQVLNTTIIIMVIFITTVIIP